jgi:plasmid stability protein
VRTTLTLDEDVAAKLESEARRSGRSFKQVVNDLLRSALNARPAAERRRPFAVKARDLGLRRGLSYDSVSDLLEQVEGPLGR